MREHGNFLQLLDIFLVAITIAEKLSLCGNVNSDFNGNVTPNVNGILSANAWAWSLTSARGRSRRRA
jgi:hypothetical protein